MFALIYWFKKISSLQQHRSSFISNLFVPHWPIVTHVIVPQFPSFEPCVVPSFEVLIGHQQLQLDIVQTIVHYQPHNSFSKIIYGEYLVFVWIPHWYSNKIIGTYKSHTWVHLMQITMSPCLKVLIILSTMPIH